MEEDESSRLRKRSVFSSRHLIDSPHSGSGADVVAHIDAGGLPPARKKHRQSKSNGAPRQPTSATSPDVTDLPGDVEEGRPVLWIARASTPNDVNQVPLQPGCTFAQLRQTAAQMTTKFGLEVTTLIRVQRQAQHAETWRHVAHALRTLR